MSAVLGWLQRLGLLRHTLLLKLFFHLHDQGCTYQHNPTALNIVVYSWSSLSIVSQDQVEVCRPSHFFKLNASLNINFTDKITDNAIPRGLQVATKYFNNLHFVSLLSFSGKAITILLVILFQYKSKIFVPLAFASNSSFGYVLSFDSFNKFSRTGSSECHLLSSILT